jgi:pectinesterase
MPRLNRRRLLLAAAGASLPSPALARAHFDAVVGPGGFASVGEALTAAPANSNGWRIRIGEGRWREKLVIDKPNIALIGASRSASVIVHDDASRTPNPAGGTIGTGGSFTLAVRAPGFQARNLTIENSFDYNAAVANARGDQQAAGGLQAVALMLDVGADQTLIEACDLNGFQDTLYANRGLALFRRCRIAGTVDFIFGASRSLFQDCEIVTRPRPDAVGRVGWISAASTPRDQFYGLTFLQCRLTREAGVPDASVGLGRFWRPTRDYPDGRYGDPDAVGASAFIRCWMDAHIAPEGWDEMGYNARGGGRANLLPQDARPAEYDSSGPGASARAFQLTRAQARLYSQRLVLGDWRLRRL